MSSHTVSRRELPPQRMKLSAASPHYVDTPMGREHIMDRVWITNGSTSIPPVVNPLMAACHDGYVPTDIYILNNPIIDDVTDAATSLMKTVVTAQGGDEPSITVETIDEETDFEAITTYLQSAIEAGADANADIAVDISPGRRFWSVISFQAGVTHDVNHLYYSHVETEAYFGETYPTIPRTAVNLIDFTEVI
jgi:hypothetical protein